MPAEPEVVFRIVHVALDGDPSPTDAFPSPSYREQTVEVGLGPNPTFPTDGVGAVTRTVSTDEVVTAMPSSRRNTRRLHKPKPPGPPRVAESLRKAIEWRRQLDAGEVTNQAAIARREGVTRARVTQVLGLLRLPEETRAQILEMPQGSAHRGLSEHALRQAKRAPA